MAEGGGEFRYVDPELDDTIDNDDYEWDYEEEEEEEVGTTRPFQPGGASTPYHFWEQHEMQIMQEEQSGLPVNEETPLLGAQAEAQRSWDALTSFFPDASSIDLEANYSKTGRLQVKMAGIGKKAYELFTKDRSGMQKLNPKLTKEIKRSLGTRAEQIIEEDRNTAEQQRQRTEEAEKQLLEAENFSADKKEEQQEIKVLKEKEETAQAKIDAIQEVEGSNLESEAELHRLKQLRKNYQTDTKKRKRNWPIVKNKQKKKQKTLKEKFDQEREKLYEIERKNKTMEERLNEAKRLDELNEEDRAIINDPDASEVDKEAAEKRIEARLQGEDTMPLGERVREIFKKYGVTVTAIFLAAGVTIGAVVGAITNALKSMGNQLANGLKTLGTKAASALPGLIGAIVSFLYKTAGQAIGYLAEHTWLLILAAVVFIFEKYIKRR